MTTITNLVCEYRANPLGIDVAAPRLSWQISSDRAGARQAAYRVLAATDPARLSEGRADLWDSGRVESDQSVHVAYMGKRLASRQRVYWKVMVWDNDDHLSASAPAWFEMGLLRRSDWKAKWIGAALVGGPRSTIPAPYLRKFFVLPGAVPLCPPVRHRTWAVRVLHQWSSCQRRCLYTRLDRLSQAGAVQGL